MTSVYKHQFRAECVIRNFGRCVFLTLTTADVCALSDIRCRWRDFRNDYFRSLGYPRYIMCYEPHPGGHGWHIHAVIERKWLDLAQLRKYAHRACFGRLHVEVVRNDGLSRYISKYIVKSVVKSKKDCALRRVRLINQSRGLTRLSDILEDSPIKDYVRACMADSMIDKSNRYWGLSNYRLCMAFLCRNPDVDIVPSCWVAYRDACELMCGYCRCA